jgi:hypothetical protein
MILTDAMTIDTIAPFKAPNASFSIGSDQQVPTT